MKQLLIFDNIQKYHVQRPVFIFHPFFPRRLWRRMRTSLKLARQLSFIFAAGTRRWWRKLKNKFGCFVEYGILYSWLCCKAIYSKKVTLRLSDDLLIIVLLLLLGKL